MDKISVTLREDQVGYLSDLVGEKYDDRSKAVRDLLDRGFQYEELKNDLEQTEARVDDLRRQLQEANAGRRDVDEIVSYVEEERELQRHREEREQRREQRRNAPAWRRARWWLFGMPDDE
jgi:SOS response regulatory protein OraA/RecX